MSFVPPQLVLAAVEALDGAHPLAVVSIPALLRAGSQAQIDPTDRVVPFGSTEESSLLSEFFALPRPPDNDRPYYAPWARSSTSDPSWQTQKYAGGGLQRQRDLLLLKGIVFRKVRPEKKGRDHWGLTPRAGRELLDNKKQNHAVRLVDLALWFGRDVDVDTIVTGVELEAEPIDKLMVWFRQEFQPDCGDLVGTLYTDDIPADYRAAPFTDTPVEEGTYELLGSLPPAPAVEGTLTDLVSALEERVSSRKFVLPPGLVRRVLVAWMRGDIVVLVGQPGTGKSMFARELGRAMEAELGLDTPLVVPIRADYDEAEFIGYERLDGSPEYREFTTTVLQTADPLEARVVILEEFNLAAVETYLSSILVAKEDQERLVRLPAGGQAHLPIDTFIIATCNSYRDEPETRTRVSSPTKRRSTVITMPNVLGDRYDEDPDNAVLTLAAELIEKERGYLEDRSKRSASAQFDSLRLLNLNTITDIDSLSSEVRDVLQQIAAAILETAAGHSWFTMGLLRDVILNIAHADRTPTAELTALGHSVADKLIHQVRGVNSDVEDLQAAYAGLPNAEEIQRLVERMMDGPSDELLSLL